MLALWRDFKGMSILGDDSAYGRDGGPLWGIGGQMAFKGILQPSFSTVHVQECLLFNWFTDNPPWAACENAPVDVDSASLLNGGTTWPRSNP
jgi:hypothetical protein